ncbi:uncharacterized protein [Clytia hemisphaerica]|uniref:EamA domain-containing protein n=1 Tax=Clytia hemisphaerica TaxID=252671 RepID=A0A7M5V6U6_9CNID
MDGNKASRANKIVQFVAVFIALLALQIGFGAYGVIYTKLAKGAKTTALVFCFYRDAGCTPVLFLAAYVAERRIQFIKTKGEFLLFFIMGFFGMFINQFSYIQGVVFTTPDTASMFQALIPILVVIVAILVKNEPFPKIRTKTGLAKLLGILFATVGALVMAYAKQNAKNKSDADKNLTPPTWYGYLFLVSNITCSAGWMVVQKKFIFNRMDSRFREYPINTTAWTYFSGAVCMGFASIYYAEKPSAFAVENHNVIFCLLYAIFITSAMCYMLITWCNMQVNSSFVAATWPLQVLFCAILSYIVLGEVMVALQVVGGLMIIGALLAVTWSSYTEQMYSHKQPSLECHVEDENPLLYAE